MPSTLSGQDRKKLVSLDGPAQVGGIVRFRIGAGGREAALELVGQVGGSCSGGHKTHCCNERGGNEAMSAHSSYGVYQTGEV
jgi:hypothetical protein